MNASDDTSCDGADDIVERMVAFVAMGLADEAIRRGTEYAVEHPLCRDARFWLELSAVYYFRRDYVTAKKYRQHARSHTKNYRASLELESIQRWVVLLIRHRQFDAARELLRRWRRLPDSHDGMTASFLTLEGRLALHANDVATAARFLHEARLAYRTLPSVYAAWQRDTQFLLLQVAAATSRRNRQPSGRIERRQYYQELCTAHLGVKRHFRARVLLRFGRLGYFIDRRLFGV